MRLVIDPKKTSGTFPFYYDMYNIPDEKIIMRVDSSLRLVVLCVKVTMFLQCRILVWREIEVTALPTFGQGGMLM